MGNSIITRRGGKSGGGVPSFPNITYNGIYEKHFKVYSDGSLYAEYMLITSGALTVTGSYTGDIFAWGGGGGGGVQTASAANRGTGGGAGFVAKAYGIPIISGSISIGGGGRNNRVGGSTSGFGYTATGGEGGKNGSASVRPSGGGGSAKGGGTVTLAENSVKLFEDVLSQTYLGGTSGGGAGFGNGGIVDSSYSGQINGQGYGSGGAASYSDSNYQYTVGKGSAGVFFIRIKV